MATAIESYYGNNVVAAPGANYRLRLPHGENGARLYSLTPSVGSLKVILPDARKCAPATTFILFNRSGTHALDIVCNDTTTSIGTLPAGDIAEAVLLTNATANGTWLRIGHSSSVAAGSAITIGRQPWRVTLRGAAILRFNLRAHLDAQGYDGVTKVAAVVEIAANTVVGGDPNFASDPAFYSGAFPAGSTLLLINRGAITGFGGNGGHGAAIGGGAPAGSAGGKGLRVDLNTALVNYGSVYGGGGGGGGGQNSSTQAGGGGGGGSGYLPGLGGASGGAGATAGSNGSEGLGGAGGTGAFSGGAGGSFGTAGGDGGGVLPNFPGGAGGAAGNAIEKLTGITLTKVRTGTIAGAEVFV